MQCLLKKGHHQSLCLPFACAGEAKPQISTACCRASALAITLERGSQIIRVWCCWLCSQPMPCVSHAARCSMSVVCLSCISQCLETCVAFKYNLLQKCVVCNCQYLQVYNFPSNAESLSDHPGAFLLLAAVGLLTSFTSTVMFTAGESASWAFQPDSPFHTCCFDFALCNPVHQLQHNGILCLSCSGSPKDILSRVVKMICYIGHLSV